VTAWNFLPATFALTLKQVHSFVQLVDLLTGSRTHRELGTST